ncbi:MAG: class I SAM-dependent methyltransferase [Cytophagales bacterium]|nr:class I SAM-dependent methyltransferase [Cytophagales bacterium]
MFEKLEECPSCGHPKFENYLICTDHSVSGESFALVKCAKCELIFTNPRPVREKLSSYYQSDEYISHTNQANNLVNWIYTLVRGKTLMNKLKLISQKYVNGKLLDFGCGTGHFIRYSEQHGWTVTGLEPNKQARKLATTNLNGAVYKKISEIKESFDIITAWHVIEHVPNLNETIKELSKRLNHKGFLFIALPNCKSYDAAHYKEKWAGYDVPRHLYHFTQNSFGALLSKHKLKLVETIPMKYDSHYVSLLSEKSTTGNRGYLKAFQIGRKSNNAAKHSLEYSSLIYVISK